MIDYNIIKKTKTRIKYKGIDPEMLSTFKWYPKIYENPFRFDFDLVKKRMEEARLAHEKEVARLRIKRRKLQKYISWGVMGVVTWIFGMGIVWIIVAIFRV